MITTIITTYKRPLLLKRALKSVLNQTYPHFQVFIYDNASNDETETIVKEMSQTDSRIHYHKHPHNIGMMANYAYAFSKIKTPYFSFLSDDDYFLPWFFETALEGFSKNPDAAFSSCGVLAVNKSNDVVADPLSEWSREGLYSVPEGLLEMISSKNFPQPTGILFQHAIVKEIHPDWSPAIQVMWDPDYLIQIAARFPITITKKVCGIYYAHEEAFSTGFYKNILESTKNLDAYFTAVLMIMQKIEKNPLIDHSVKKAAVKAYRRSLKNEISNYMHNFVENNNFKAVYYSTIQAYKYCGVNIKIIKLTLKSVLKHKYRKIYDTFQNIFSKKNPVVSSKPCPPSHWRSFQDYQEYAHSINSQ